MITNGENSLLNRTNVLTFWANHQRTHDPVSFLFGNDLGSSHQDAGGHMGIRYPRYGIGLAAASTMLWDMAVFGFGLFAATQATLSLLAFHIFYRLELQENLSFQIVFAAVEGYLAYLYCSHVGSMARSRP